MAHKHSRHRFFELACICFVAALLGWFLFPSLGPIIRGEQFTQDLIIAHGPKPPLARDFVFVTIDDASLKLDQLWPEDIKASSALQSMEKGWPWSRNVYAEAIEKILKAGARIVILDVILDQDRGQEEALKLVLDQYSSRVVLGANIIDDTINQSHRNILGTTIRVPSPSLIENAERDPRVGYVNFRFDSDGIVRAATYHARLGGTGHKDERAYPSLSAAALRQMREEKSIPEGEHNYFFRYGDYSTLPQVSIYSLFVPVDWKTVMKNGDLFRNKIVMIGPTASILHDTQATPFGDLPGPILHISALAAAIYKAFYRLATPPIAAATVLLAAIITLLVGWRIRHPIAALGILLAISGAYLGAVSWIANHLDYLLPSTSPILVLLISGIGCISWSFAQEHRESGRMRSTLERYVSRNVVREILDNRDDFLTALGGTRRPMTVFFSDVRGFTTIAEHEDAAAVVEQLNEYLGEMVGIIFKNHGTVDKFMGDGIMAVWGNVISEGPAIDATRAVSTALEMLDHLAVLNTNWKKRNLATFRIGIGLHHGEAVFGNIGSSEKMEPTVIGDTVNLASRVEGLTKKYGIAICITQSLGALINDRFLLRSVDLVQVVGTSHPIEILTVLGPKDMEIPEWIKSYEKAVLDFRARRFAEAAATFRLCLEADPTDPLSTMYLERSNAFISNPPSEDWNGTEIATSK